MDIIKSLEIIADGFASERVTNAQAKSIVPTLREAIDTIRNERKRCLDIVETYQVSVGNSPAGELACQWTMDALKDIADQIREGSPFSRCREDGA